MKGCWKKNGFLDDHKWKFVFVVVLFIAVGSIFAWAQAGSDYTKLKLQNKEVVLVPAPHALLTFVDVNGREYQKNYTLTAYERHDWGGAHFISQASGQIHSYPVDGWVLAMMIAAPLFLLTTCFVLRISCEDW